MVEQERGRLAFVLTFVRDKIIADVIKCIATKFGKWFVNKSPGALSRSCKPAQNNKETNKNT